MIREEPGMTAEANAAAGRPVGRVRFMDAQRVNLDGFAVEDADLGLVAMRSPYDPEPGLVIRDGRVTEMDGVPEDRFDSLDSYIARHGLDLAVAQEAMSLPDVALSTGSACSSATAAPSHVLKALGLTEDQAHSSLRFGLGRFTTEEEIDYAAARVVEAVRKLRELSPATHRVLY